MYIIQQKIVAHLSKNNGCTAKEIVNYLFLNASGVFRHLKKLQNKGLVYKVGKPPKVRYYTFVDNMKNQSKLFTNAINWATSGDVSFITPDQACQTRDVFQARADRLIVSLKKTVKNENLVYLLAAMVGEIGNNSFDHNIGNWLGVPGIFFAVDETERQVIIADRGQGVLSTLKRVRPQIENDSQALQVAFTETVSGRAPEQRGNGLKFVKKVVMENNLRLSFYSGDAVAEIDARGIKIKKSAIDTPGTLCIITF